MRCDGIRPGVLRIAGSALAVLAIAVAARAARAIPVAAAGDAVPRAAILDLPRYIGVLDYMGERTRTDHRPGHTYSYRAAGLGLDIDVFEYDPRRIPDGATSPLIRRELARMERRLLARGAKIVRTGTVALGAPQGVEGAVTDAPITASEVVFARRGGRFTGTSYLWVTARGGRLYDIHFDVRRGFEDDGIVSRSECLSALGRAIETLSRRPQAQPPDRIDVAIQWDPATPPAERPLWTAYLYTRAAFVAAESHDVALPLGEHTASFREEVRGRLIAVNLYRELARKDPALHSAYFADLARVEAAGFLREYVWRYLRKPSWSRPDGLRLASFDAWRAVHLEGHVPETYGQLRIVPIGRGAAPAEVAAR